MIELVNIDKVVKNSSNDEITILNDISVTFEDKGIYFISGKSGSGKTSLLNILCGLSSPTRGEFIYKNEKVYYDKSQSLYKLYNDSSFVFQESLFILKLSVIENIKIIGIDDNKKIDEILKYVDLFKSKNTKVSLLSGGERQRLAIAISLIKGSNYIILDEPTASLDYDNKFKVMDLLKKISKDKLVVIASHDQEIINKYADYIYEISNGKINNFIDCNKNSFDIEIHDDNKDYIFEIYENIKKYNINKIIVNEIEYEINNKNLLISLESIFANYTNKKINIKFIKENRIANDTIKIDSNSKPNFSFQMQLKYAFSLIRESKIKSILIVILLVLSFLLSLFQLNINTLKVYDINYNNFKTNNFSYIQVYKKEYNNNLQEDLDIYSGKDIRSELIQNNIPILESIELETSIILRLYIIDNNIFYNNYYIDVSNNNIVTSKTAYSLIDTNYSKIGIYEFDNINYVCFDSEIDNDLLNAYKSNKLSPEQNDKLLNNLFVGFISKKYYLELMHANNYFYEKAPSINSICENFDYYSSNKIRYISSNQLADNQVILTSALLKTYRLTKEDVINKKIYNCNLRESKNYKRYIDDINLSDLYNDLIVKDVIDDENYDIYISMDYYDKYMNESLNYLNVSADVSKYDYIKTVNDLNYDYNSMLVSNTNNFITLINKQFKPVLLSVMITIIIITAIIISVFSNIIVDRNIREICLLKAYGIKQRRIINSFLIYNLISVFISYIISAISFTIIVNLLNDYLKNKDVLNVNFNVINNNYLILFILFICLIFISLLSTIIPTYKIKKYDLYYLLKNS